MLLLELKGCGVLSEASINCPLLTSLDASFCRSSYEIAFPSFSCLLLLCLSPFTLFLFSPLFLPSMLKLTLFSFSRMQPIEGWMLICNSYFMSAYWFTNLNVVPICWSWWTLFFAPASTFNFTRSIVHLFDKFAACFRVLFAVEGTFIMLVLKVAQYKCDNCYRLLYPLVPCGHVHAYMC